MTGIVLALVLAAGQALPVYDGHLLPGWTDYGWAPRQLGPGPARLDLSRYGGWILAHGAPIPEGVSALTFRIDAPRSYGTFIEVRLDSPTFELPGVAIDDKHCRPSGAMQLCTFGMWELTPRMGQVDRIVFRARKAVGSDPVFLDDIRFVSESVDAPQKPKVAMQSANVRIRCDQPAHAISPLIYGIAYSPMHDAKDDQQWSIGATTRRWGGNPTSRYNWELGNAWNTASDYFFRNTNYTSDPHFNAQKFLDANVAHGVGSALTVPILGWVAKDTTSYSFPVSVFGPQQKVADENRDMGNGVTPEGRPIPPGSPTATSIQEPDGFVRRWIASIRKHDEATGKRSLSEVILDNEPMLWHETHRDVHPEPVTYDELFDRTSRAAIEARKADPQVLIAGPALWGWPAYFYSAQDAKIGFTLHPDRLRHGNTPLLPWWLSRMRALEKRTGLKLLDVVDVHYYPQALGVGIQRQGAIDPAAAARRLRAPRSLWDPTYVDESWIHESIRLIPRLREWIAANAPGVRIQIGEWNMGAEEDMSGGLAVAETLGRFAQEDLFAAYYWDYPPKNSPAAFGFRAFRNFDGKGGRFLDQWVPASTTQPLVSVFASRDPAQKDHLVVVLLNLDPEMGVNAHLDFGRCGTPGVTSVFHYEGKGEAFAEVKAEATHAEEPLLPYSMTVVDVRLKPR